MKEKDQSEFRIPGIDGIVLEAVVKFCYNGVTDVNEDNVEALLMAALYLQMETLQTLCVNYYRSKIQVSNCLRAWALGQQYFFIDLEKSAASFAFRNFKKVIKCEEFLCLDSSQLISILRSDNLKIDAEEEVFDALMEWIRFDKQARRSLFMKLLENIRLQHVNESVSNSKLCYYICKPLSPLF